ncbi:hypothetical protein [Hymenobacter persicinus]|uniref:Uncharacterized protein n=1 Tax=Hymenobacter persicinus TaxID=2025506 RepID=A0A4Q5L8G9_9BACT|nr:hypothetical protein [Hymenobacter persicinus]RYU77927.1 hypothetical protein EWM57_16075 [Hymenobacter persicinus]
MRSFFMFFGLLLCGAPAFAQGVKNPASADHKGLVELPATRLPGEEKLSARERAERDFLMPVRRKQAAALRAAQDEAIQQATAEASFIGPEEAKPEEAAAPAVKATPHRTYHRRSTHRRTSSTTHKRKTTSKSGTAKKKVVTKKRRR